MNDLLEVAVKGTKFEGNERELYITICGDVRKKKLPKKEAVKEISKIILDMAMSNGYQIA